MVLDERPGVGVFLNAMALHKQYPVPPVLAEIVPVIGADRYAPLLSSAACILIPCYS